MKRLIFMRVIAQLIDIVVSLAILVGALILLPPRLLSLWNQPVFSAILSLVLAIALCILIQYPFMQTGQTIGKTLCGLQIIPTDGQPLTVPRILRRELLMKLATLYIICFPMLSGQPGGHDEACRTEVIRKQRARA